MVYRDKSDKFHLKFQTLLAVAIDPLGSEHLLTERGLSLARPPWPRQRSLASIYSDEGGLSNHHSPSGASGFSWWSAMRPCASLSANHYLPEHPQ